MLKGKVHLKDCDYKTVLDMAINRTSKHFITNNEHYYDDKYLIEAIEANIKKDLNYNCTTGKTFYGSELMGYYSNKVDIPVYENNDEIIQWEFLNWIMNSAGRLKRGYSAIG